MSLDLPGLVADVRALLARTPATRRCLLGVAGAPGAGKTTLVEGLLAALRADDVEAAHVPMDGFHLADAQLDRLGRRDRKGGPDTFDADGYAAILRRCRDDVDRDVYVPGFERDLEQPLAAALVVPAGCRLVLTEGNYLLLDGPWAPIAGILDATWHLRVDDEVRRHRLVERHVRFGKAPADAEAWVESVDEPNARLVAAAAHRADRVVDQVR